MHKNYYIIHFGKTLDQLWVEVSLELNVIETKYSFLQKEGIYQIELNKTSQKWVSSPQNIYYHRQTAHKYEN